jgi:putative peptidoglycan lipid II flippase
MIRILSAARTVVIFGLILQVAGFVKLLVIADYFGAGPLLDAYYLGLVVPTFLASLSAGILQTAFVPAYVGARARGSDTVARTLGNATLTWTTLTLATSAGLLTLMRAAALPLLSQDASPETRTALQSAFTPLMWTAPLNGLADGGAMLLNAEGRFAAAASAPLLNVVAGVIVLIAFRNRGVDALVWSLLAGLALQALVVLIAIRGAGFRLRPQLTLPAGPSRLLGSVALPVLISNVLGNLIPAFIQMVSARAGIGAISAMGYASRLHNSLVQAVVMSVSVVLLPHFARLTAQGRNAELRVTLERVFAATLLFSAAAVVLVSAGGPAVIQLMLQRGRFTSADAHLVARVWLALTTGLLGATWGIFLARLFQAQRLPWVIATLACVSVIVNVTLAFAFLSLWGVVGVALASSVAYTVIMWLFHVRSRRVLGHLLGASARGFIARTMLTNIVAYGAALWWRGIFEDSRPLVVVVGQVVIVVVANFLVARSAPLHLTVRAILRG